MLRIKKSKLSVLLFSIMLTSSISVQLVMAAGNLGKISESDFYDSANNLYVVGEVQNTGDVAVSNVNVKILFYNSTNQLIKSISGYSDLNVILPGRRSFYSIKMLASEGALDVFNHTTWFNWTDTPDGKPLGLAILSNSTSIDSDGHMHVNGTVQNQGAVNSNNTEVSVTFYNSSGVVVGTSWVFSTPANLAPNQTATYEAELVYPLQVAKVARFSLTAESNSLALVPEFSTLLLPSLLLVAMTLGVLFFKKQFKLK